MEYKEFKKWAGKTAHIYVFKKMASDKSVTGIIRINDRRSLFGEVKRKYIIGMHDEYDTPRQIIVAVAKIKMQYMPEKRINELNGSRITKDEFMELLTARQFDLAAHDGNGGYKINLDSPKRIIDITVKDD